MFQNDPHEVCLPILIVPLIAPSHQLSLIPRIMSSCRQHCLNLDGYVANRDVLERQTAVRVLTDDSQGGRATRNKHLHRFYNKSSTRPPTDERIPGRQQRAKWSLFEGSNPTHFPF